MARGPTVVASRFIGMTSDIAGANFVPTHVTVREGISAPFAIRVDAYSSRRDIPPEELLYSAVSIGFMRDGNALRWFNGLVREFWLMETDIRGQSRYVLDLVPCLWFAAQTSDCRVFVNETVEDIITEVLPDCRLSFRVAGTKRIREYTVQMNETDLIFISRLLQEEGWFYYFEHNASSHTMVVADANTVFQPIGGPAMDLTALADSDACLYQWLRRNSTTHGSVALMDYNPEAPLTDLEGETATRLNIGGAPARDYFRWPALSLARNEIDRRTLMIMEAEEAQASLIDGSGRNPRFCPGGRFVLAKDPQTGAQNTSFVAHTVVHEATEDVTENSRVPTSYCNSFTAFQLATPWRDKLSLHRPFAQGIFSATVLGNDGEEIHTDELGRVKVRFPWDRRKASTADTSIWLRVVQPWAGPGFGTQFIPRVGSEVAVAFVDGDIDRPIVLGGLYNAVAKPPWTLTDKKTISGVRTRSTENGGTRDYSELSFDDKKGDELVFFQAQKNLKSNIKAGESRTVGADQTVEIGGTRSVTIDKGDDKLEVKEGKRTIDIKQGDMNIDLGMGNVSLKVELGGVTIEAMQSITLKVGESSLVLDQTGITMKGMLLSSQAQISYQAKGAMTSVSGDGMLTLKGALTMIN